MYGEMRGIRNKTVLINYNVVRIPSSEGNVEVAFGIFGHRPRCELSNIRKRGRNSVAWNNCSADKNYVKWNKSKNITYSEKDCGLFYILEFTFVWNINLWKTKQSLTHSHFRGRHKQRCCALSEHSSDQALCYSKTSTLQTHTYEKLKWKTAQKNLLWRDLTQLCEQDH